MDNVFGHRLKPTGREAGGLDCYSSFYQTINSQRNFFVLPSIEGLRTRKAQMTDVSIIPAEHIERKIYFIRNQKVMLDSDLSSLYDVETKYLTRAVQRNKNRFPSDFSFQLSDEEVTALRCQFGTSKKGRGGRRYAPWVFTEHGILMLSSVLRNERAAMVNVQIMRSFVKLREMIASHEYLLQRLDDLEERYDQNFREVFATLRELIAAPISNKNPIGFGREASKDE